MNYGHKNYKNRCTGKKSYGIIISLSTLYKNLHPTKNWILSQKHCQLWNIFLDLLCWNHVHKIVSFHVLLFIYCATQFALPLPCFEHNFTNRQFYKLKNRWKFICTTHLEWLTVLKLIYSLIKYQFLSFCANTCSNFTNDISSTSTCTVFIRTITPYIKFQHIIYIYKLCQNYL